MVKQGPRGGAAFVFGGVKPFVEGVEAAAEVCAVGEAFFDKLLEGFVLGEESGVVGKEAEEDADEHGLEFCALVALFVEFLVQGGEFGGGGYGQGFVALGNGGFVACDEGEVLDVGAEAGEFDFEGFVEDDAGKSLI